MKRARALAAASMVLGVGSALFAADSYVDSPGEAFAIVAVGSEWSARILLVALVALAGAGVGWRGSRTLAGAGVVGALAAMALSLGTWLDARKVAENLGISLSWGTNLVGPSDPEPDVRPNLAFTGDDTPRRLDAYLPRTPGPHPAVVVVHGGSWIRGEKSEIPGFDRWLASEGYAVFDAEYRLAPAPNWRESIADVKCAVAWVRSKAAEFSVDPDRIALLGRSAGGHLALVAAYAASSPQLAAACPGDARVAAVVSFYPPADLSWSYGNPANQRVLDGPATLARYLGGSPSDALVAYRLASPISYAGPQTPPTLLFHGGRDQFVRPENSDRLAERLGSSGAPYEIVRLPWAHHGFDFAPGGWGEQIARHEIRLFLGRSMPAK